MADTPEEIAKHTRLYWYIGGALFVLTALTVLLGVAQYHENKFTELFDFGAPGLSYEDVIIGLLVATVKALLVSLIFMHLNHEKPLIYKFLVFTFCFALGMMVLSLLAWWNPIVDPTFYSGN